MSKKLMIETAFNIFPVPKQELISKSRDFRLVKFRYYFIKILSDYNFKDEEIGKLLNIHRTTVINGRKKLNELIGIYHNTRAEFAGYKSKFNYQLKKEKKARSLPTHFQMQEQDYINLVFEKCKYSKIGITGKSRDSDLVKHRYFVIYLLRQRNLSFNFIAKILNRDHSTVMYGYDTIKNRIQIEKEVRDEFYNYSQLIFKREVA